jgi:ribosome modulation factor
MRRRQRMSKERMQNKGDKHTVAGQRKDKFLSFQDREKD